MYELSTLIAALRRHSRLAAALFLVFVAIGAVAVMLLPATYATSSQVLIKRPPDTTLQSTNSPVYPQIDALLAFNRDTAMETYVALARQPVIAEEVVRKLGLKISASELLGKNVTVTPLTNTDIIKISADWHTADGSASIANAFARAFIEQQRVLAASQASEAVASLSLALEKSQRDLSSAERALTDFESQHGLSDANTQTTTLLAAINDVQAKERTVEADRREAQGQLTMTTNQLSASPQTIDASTTIGSSPVADQIEQQLSQQQLQLNLLRRQFTEKYPDVIAAEKQIASLKAALARAPASKVTGRDVQPNPLNTTLASKAATLQAQIAGDSSQLTLLRSQEAALSDQLQEYPQSVSELTSLQRQTKAAEIVHDALQSSYSNAVVAKSMAVSDLTIIQDADPSLATATPPRLTALLAVGAVALFAMIGIICLLDWYAAGTMSLSEVR